MRGDSLPLGGANENKIRHSTPVRISATAMAASTASTYEMTIGLNRAPATPSINKAGRTASKVISVTKKMVPRVPEATSRTIL